eukprot:COSAG03_NODE_3132_length_2190_cov_1.451937_1_plen_154_part_10
MWRRLFPRRVGTAWMATPSVALAAFAECFSGGVAGWLSSFVLFPLDVVKTRMQGGEEGSALDIARRLVKKGGIAMLWTGGNARGLQSMIEKVGYFYSYTFMKRLLERTGPMGVATQLAVGYFVRVPSLCMQRTVLVFALTLFVWGPACELGAYA